MWLSIFNVKIYGINKLIHLTYIQRVTLKYVIIIKYVIINSNSYEI